MPPKHDLNQSLGEESEFPSVCETCLGANPYVRMSQQNRGAECKVCTRPFTVFRWNPGAGMRFKKTEVCLTCAKLKNCCQTCLLDLQYGLPVQVRDAALQQKNNAPSSDINREYYAQNIEASGQLDGINASSYGKSNPAGKDILKKLARQDPNYKRNRPHVCSFYAKGNCTRGDTCPYRHELPVQNDMSRQNIQDRYYGRNDPVAKKIMGEHAAGMGLPPPEDKSIISLFLTSLPENPTEDSIRNFFESLPIKSVVIVAKSRCAFVNFINRETAEEAARRAAMGVNIAGQNIKVQWGRSRPKKNAPSTSAASTSTSDQEQQNQEQGESSSTPSIAQNTEPSKVES